MEEQKKEFTGVWIPRHVMEDEKLKPVDRLVFAEIGCFDVCVMSNATLAQRAGCSENTASRSVARLKRFGYVVVTNFDGRVRKMQCLHVVPPQNGEADYPKMVRQPHQNGAIDNNIDNNIELTTKVVRQKPSNEISELFDYWESVVGYKIESNVKGNRYACSNLIKKHTAEGVKRLVQGVALANKDRYAPRIADFRGLQARYNDLVAWGKRKTDNSSVVVI